LLADEIDGGVMRNANGSRGFALVAVACVVLFMGCGETGGMSATGGTAGTGGAGGEGGAGSRTLDQTCRDWCANEPGGVSCHQGPVGTVADCYRDCLDEYEIMVSALCGDEFHALMDCHLEFECNDLFGDCALVVDGVSECAERALNREYCQTHCPEMNLDTCSDDPSLCSAQGYCRLQCPTQNFDECVAQYLETGTCAHAEAIETCTERCSQQELGACVDQWLLEGTCDFDDSSALCGAGRTIDTGGFSTAVGTVSCDALGVITVPFRATLAARPVGGAINAGVPTEFQVQIELAMDEDTVENLGALVAEALIGESWAVVEEAVRHQPVSVQEVPTPCGVDFSRDTNNNGTPGPVEIATPIITAAWTESAGSITLQLTEMTFMMTQPVPLPLSTAGNNPACVFETVPSLTFNVAP
jgi:hypothetical protein